VELPCPHLSAQKPHLIQRIPSNAYIIDSPKSATIATISKTERAGKERGQSAIRTMNNSGFGSSSLLSSDASDIHNNDNDGGDDDDDFILQMESSLEGEVEVDDFVCMFERELEETLISEAAIDNTSLLEAPASFDGAPFMFEDPEVDGKCRDIYQFGDIFSSCWYSSLD